jgi:hypothetical protein
VEEVSVLEIVGVHSGHFQGLNSGQDWEFGMKGKKPVVSILTLGVESQSQNEELWTGAVEGLYLVQKG